MLKNFDPDSNRFSWSLTLTNSEKVNQLIVSHLGPLFLFVEYLLELLRCNSNYVTFTLLLITLFFFTIYIFLIILVSSRPSFIIAASSGTSVIPSTDITSILFFLLSFILCSVVSLIGVNINTVISKIKAIFIVSPGSELPTLLLAYFSNDLKFIFWCFFERLFNYFLYWNWLFTSLITKELKFGMFTFFTTFLYESKLKLFQIN